MIRALAIAMLFQVFPDPPRPPEPTSPPQPLACVARGNVINAYLVQTCIAGLERLGLGTALHPERQSDGTWRHRVPFRSKNGSAFETTICGIDLIDFSFSSTSGAVINASQSADPAQYCVTKGYSVAAGPVTLEVHTRTESPKLVIRSSVITAPLATILQQPPTAAATTFMVIPPPPIVFIPPPPPPVVPPASTPPPPL